MIPEDYRAVLGLLSEENPFRNLQLFVLAEDPSFADYVRRISPPDL
ncbi:hypothetical protein V5E97_24020 [Singulisphaera sp. Ch08]|uniref:Uncharacterized protein n=1 Tax=Singulisphaera sp. Ch08 TaxID=3120278 RepID=A0AAU7C8G8_9BACT